MKILLPETVLTILHTLNAAGFPSYVVGGPVRDLLRGKTPADWDMTTAAKPEQVMALFDKTIPTGIKHGTVTVLIGGEPFEVTTFRVDGTYADHRRPEQVVFTDDITADLSRRDFTMNAMAYHPETGLCDPFGGQDDIERGLIRSVGDPMVRFDEDALRMMRAVRFAAQTGFAIHEDILEAIKKQAGLLSAVSFERVRDELMKILLSDRPDMIEILHETGLLAQVIPEFDRCFWVEQHTKYHCYDVGHHSIEVLKHVPKDAVLRLAALLHDVAKPDAKTTDEQGVDHFKGHDAAGVLLADEILTRLRIDNHTKDAVLHLIRFHDSRPAATKRSVRRAMAAVGRDVFLALLALMRADAMGQAPAHGRESLERYDAVEALYHEIVQAQDAVSVAELAINGRDLLELGISGVAVGDALQRALDYVLEHPEQNQKAVLLEGIKNKIF
ncbi:MAG: CCA tRNA nucleotidyltransferase [Ruminococcaceae bacterium]|nr:CCA tRNA nucleotidyltransferase [Oscillospiraceae bacterium]